MVYCLKHFTCKSNGTGPFRRTSLSLEIKLELFVAYTESRFNIWFVEPEIVILRPGVTGCEIILCSA